MVNFNRFNAFTPKTIGGPQITPNTPSSTPQTTGSGTPAPQQQVQGGEQQLKNSMQILANQNQVQVEFKPGQIAPRPVFDEPTSTEPSDKQGGVDPSPSEPPAPTVKFGWVGAVLRGLSKIIQNNWKSTLAWLAFDVAVDKVEQSGKQEKAEKVENNNQNNQPKKPPKKV